MQVTTHKVHKLLQQFGLIKCKNPAHNERGYSLKHQKIIARIDVFFNSFELLDEVVQHLTNQEIKIKQQCRRDLEDGCWLSIEQR